MNTVSDGKWLNSDDQSEESEETGAFTCAYITVKFTSFSGWRVWAGEQNTDRRAGRI